MRKNLRNLNMSRGTYYINGEFNYIPTSGFGPRVRARALRAPVILISLSRPTGRCAPPRLSQLRCFYLSLKAFPQARTRPPGGISFYWAKLHPAELHCILMNYAAPS